MMEKIVLFRLCIISTVPGTHTQHVCIRHGNIIEL